MYLVSFITDQQVNRFMYLTFAWAMKIKLDVCIYAAETNNGHSG
jgi:hypothetical protein